MQSLTAPIDAEAALARDLTALCGFEVAANPSADIGGSSPVAHVVQVGCAPVTAVSWEHDLSIDVYAGGYPDYGPAMNAARRLAGMVATLHGRAVPSGTAWKSPTVTSVYPNPDPNHAGVPRVTVACNAAARGEDI
ncbi:hypothetical protein [Olsenella uli]|uniref:hypothetical protein n=1 Tax=Olsenella uli TaxID=133926 RepID=UPI00241D857D|nr:hypothetical protein [Olsenella uli]